MNTRAPAPPQLQLLLVEPQFVLRRTIVAVAHDLHIARFQEATSVDSAARRLAERPFDGIVIDMFDGIFELMSRLREGAFPSRPDTAIIAMTAITTDEQRDARFLSLGHSSVLRKPFKIAELLQMIQRMGASATGNGCIAAS